jgi:hypothetical protein
MLDPWIIEEIRRREEERRREREAFRIELPLVQEEDRRPAPRHDDAEKSNRGVVVIDL